MEYHNTNDDEIVNDKYEPVEPNYYEYKALNDLEQDIDKLLQNYKITSITSIQICAFEINNEAKYPFLKFYLHKNDFNNSLNFLSLDFNNDFTNANIIKLQSKIYLYNYLNLNNFNDFSEIANYKGSCIENNNLYIFYDLTDCKLQINDIYSDSKIWVCLLDEIMNENKSCDFNISLDVIDFFLNNLDFCFLYNKNNEKYYLPIAGYTVKEDNLLQFTYTFGVTKSTNENAIFGPYYYFTNYDNALNKLDSLRKNIKNASNKKIGIVRFALFLEITKFIQNYPNDRIDYSERKLTKTNNDNNDNNTEKLMERITDYNSLWTKTYDSIFLGNIDLDNGNILDDSPVIVLKNYEQQSPLSYHYINIFNKII
jgi:hypothetical protein